MRRRITERQGDNEIALPLPTMIPDRKRDAAFETARTKTIMMQRNASPLLRGGVFGKTQIIEVAAAECEPSKRHPKRFAIVGDGGFQMTLFELATVAIHKLPVKIVVIDNKYLGMVRQWQELLDWSSACF